MCGLTSDCIDRLSSREGEDGAEMKEKDRVREHDSQLTVLD